MKDIVVFVILVRGNFFFFDFVFCNIMSGVNVDNDVNVDCFKVIGEMILFLMNKKLEVEYIFKCNE